MSSEDVIWDDDGSSQATWKSAEPGRLIREQLTCLEKEVRALTKRVEALERGQEDT